MDLRRRIVGADIAPLLRGADRGALRCVQFHLKHAIHADLRAVARPVTDRQRRQAIFEYIVDDFNQPHNPAIVRQPQRVEDWLAGSPLLEIVFPDLPADATVEGMRR
ncbi:hypothetical protein [Microbacterium sp. 10M-3C3]|jgi:hypothetical protein|uniref:hypothetical protein n=1 Tax=Microbacterium sp. 10M-3C3 TaxID=2483401 RepID=UPI000F64368C|nr:hypothetical protein [Microbacterium sp. 10M-3C3]